MLNNQTLSKVKLIYLLKLSHQVIILFIKLMTLI